MIASTAAVDLSELRTKEFVPVRWMLLGVPIGVLLAFVVTASAQKSTLLNANGGSPMARVLPGLRPDGKTLLPTQWSLLPAGRQVEVGDFPVNIALHPGGKWAAVLCAGFGDHQVLVVELESQRKVGTAIVPDAFYGLAFDSLGDRLYASGGRSDGIHAWRFRDGSLFDHQSLDLGTTDPAQIPAGLAVSPDGGTLLAACCWGHALSVLPLGTGTVTARQIPLGDGAFPYTVAWASSGKSAYVTLWGASSVVEISLVDYAVVRTIPTESHPTELLLSPDERTLYVACANSNLVSVIDLELGKPIETISSALYPEAPNGSTPNSIDISRDGNTLLVANADNNNIAVLDVSDRGKSRSLGFIPVGWYPTCVRFGVDDNLILVANGKGLTPKSNRHGPNPVQGQIPRLREYIAGLFEGTVGFIERPNADQLGTLTRRAIACSPLRRESQALCERRSANNPIPAKVGDPSPICYCIYIIKENRTFDQVLGDMPKGNGDPSLCLFPAAITPNHHALAEQFVLLDNFYVEGEVSADGHEWSMGAYATDFVEKLWPLNYRHKGKDPIGYVSEGRYELATPKGGYIWDRAREAGVSYYSFGEFVKNAKVAGEPAEATVPALEGHFDPLFRSYDLEYRDIDRAARFITKLKEFEAHGTMPRLIILRLPNDHTYGTRRGKPTPMAMVADNDLALGQVVEAVSRSKFWPRTAIFVVEDDAQNGSDHVDAHRTVALVVSPYTKRCFVDSSFYSTSSMLRTMELILGLQPMSQFDAAALPMYASFHAKPNCSAFRCQIPETDLEATNPDDAWGASMSERMNLSKEDCADDLLLNEVVWKSVKGADSPMPPPVRAAFVKVNAADEDE